MLSTNPFPRKQTILPKEDEEGALPSALSARIYRVSQGKNRR
jgi:hypothetical protein